MKTISQIILHIACGQTSHGSQLATGISGLIGCVDNNNSTENRFPSYPDNLLDWNNDWIRQYCTDNDKWLYDFADIEKYDPGESYYGDKHLNEDRSYNSGGNGSRDAKRRAYAAWWLWARLAGWDH